MTRITTLSLLLVSGLIPAAGAAQDRATPDATYRTYYARVIAGRSFDEDVGYQSAARRAEVLAQLDARAEGSDRSVEEIEAMYLDFTQGLAACGTLDLADEQVAGDSARLVYAVTDTCDTGQDGELVIDMVWEDGWKIQSDELIVTAD